MATAEGTDSGPGAGHAARLVRLVLILALAVGLGGAVWLRFGFERSAASQRVQIVADEGDVTFTLLRFPGEPAPDSEIDRDGQWDIAEPDVLTTDVPGAVATYSGPVGTRIEVQWALAPDAGKARVLVGGEERAVVDLGDPRQAPVTTLAQPLRVPPSSLLLLGVLVLLAFVPARLVVDAVLGRWRSGRRGPAAWAVGGSVAVALLVVLLWPVPPAPVQRFDVTVENLGERPEGSLGTDVFVRIERTDGSFVPAAELASEGWTERDMWATSATPGAPAWWTGMGSPDDRLQLSGHDYAGTAEVTVNGRSRIVDAYAEGGAAYRLGALAGSMPTTDRLLLAASRLGDGLLLAVVLGGAAAVVGSLTARRREPAAEAATTPADPTWAMTVRCALPVLAGWVLLLVLFWPGLMSPDSLSQWFQVENGELSDWHPYMMALILGALRTIVDSPWLPILLTVVVASVLVGRITAWSIVRGRSRRAAVLSAALLLVVPTTALMTITLWKDVVYGVALLGLALCLWRLEDTDGGWLTRRTNLALLVLAGSAAWLMRHNGWPVVLGSLVVAFVAHRRWWRQLGVVAALTTAIVAFVQFPLARALDVEPNPIDGIVYVQHVSMHLEAGTRLTDDEVEFLESIRPLDEPWPYECSSIQATWATPEAIPLSAYEDETDELRSLAIRLALRNPGAELDHAVCASRIVWQPSDAGTTTYFLEWYEQGDRVHYIPTWLTESPMENPPSQRVLDSVYDAVAFLPIWVIRPALPVYLLVASTAFAVARRRSLAPARIVAPAFLQTLALLPVTLVQDVRFQYGSVLIAVVFVPLYLALPSRSSGEPVLAWRPRGRVASSPAAGEAGDDGAEPLEAEALAGT